MKHSIIILALAILTVIPAPRTCRYVYIDGVYWRACASIMVGGEDMYNLGRTPPRPWVWSR